MQVNPELRTAIVASDATDAELRGMTAAMRKLALDTNNPFWLLIHGYDDDQRELWEIPEVAELCRRLVEVGFIAVMHVAQKPNDPDVALSALQVWLMSKGMLATGGQDVPADTFNKFWSDLMKSNYRADELARSQSPEDAQQIYALMFKRSKK
jgi:hypothetical protein